MDLYLIRHAQSANNARPTESRVEDPGITELGCQQAERLGQWIGSLNLTQVYTSAFLRTLQTTSYIHRATGIVPQVRVQLHEVGGCVAGTAAGSMKGRPGMNAAQIQEQFPGYLLPADLHANGWWNSQPYESYEAATLRAAQLLELTMQEFSTTTERIAYVMHADFKLTLLDQLAARLVDTPWNTSVTHLRLQNNKLAVERYNMVEHLEEELLSC